MRIGAPLQYTTTILSHTPAPRCILLVMEQVWKERALAAAGRGWEAMERFLAALITLSSAERAPRLERDGLIARGLKRTIQAKLRIAESLARRLILALALDMGARASDPQGPAKAGPHGVINGLDGPWTRPLNPPHAEPDRTPKPRPFRLFEHVYTLADIMGSAPLPERAARQETPRQPEAELVPAHRLKARLDAFRQAIAHPEAAAQRLIAELGRGRHAGKLHNLKLGRAPGLSWQTDPLEREPVSWLGTCVLRWAVERFHAPPAPG